MNHQITSTDSTFSVREMPWMGLLNGEVKVLEDYPDRAEAQAIAHPWDPIEQPVFRRTITMSDEGPVSSFEEIPGEKELVRSDNGDHLSVVASTRGTVTNSEMWDVAEAIGGQEGVRYETAGSLDGGKKVWILMRLDEPLQIKGDPNGGTLAFFALQGGHSRDSGAWRGQGINTRIVCANTSSWADVEADRNGHCFNFRHSSKVGSGATRWRCGSWPWRS
jgi:phage/plasmid-like protein (TIGR03299 family)